MNHTLLSCQHGAVLARRSWLQDTRVSLLSPTAPVSGHGSRGLPGQLLELVVEWWGLHVQHFFI